jgi:hypothetical protein
LPIFNWRLVAATNYNSALLFQEISMRRTQVALAGLGLIGCFGFPLLAQQAGQPATTPPGQKPPVPETKKAPPSAGTIETEKLAMVEEARKREQLEKEFQEALTGATLEGTWQMTGKDGLKGAAGLTEP